MDDLGVLTERYGLKPTLKFTPMAVLKRSVDDGETRHFGLEDDVNVELTREFSIDSKVDDGAFDDFLVFDELNKLSTDKNDDLFTKMSVLVPANDLSGDFSGLGLSSRDLVNSEADFDELIPGFGETGQPSNSATTTWTITSDDPFEVQESTLVHSSSGLCVESARPLHGDMYASSTSPLQTFPSFEFLPRATQKKLVDELAEIFGIDILPSTSLDSNNSSKYKEAENIEEKKSAAPIFGAAEFEEFPGESDKRRIARWESEQRIKNQMANAVADLNNRDRQFQIEQEEKRRISETLDAEIKLWATGKEGNIRALLSSLHLVLWPGCGWEAVSLTNLITSTSVKKVYKKANLYVHPDKVQQKGVEQKYIAEKVFNVLQEAWNKFNKEELS